MCCVEFFLRPIAKIALFRLNRLGAEEWHEVSGRSKLLGYFVGKGFVEIARRGGSVKMLPAEVLVRAYFDRDTLLVLPLNHAYRLSQRGRQLLLSR